MRIIIDMVKLRERRKRKERKRERGGNYEMVKSLKRK